MRPSTSGGRRSSEQFASVGRGWVKYTDRGVDHGVRGNVFKPSTSMDEVPEHRVEQFVEDQAEQIFPTCDAVFSELGVVDQTAVFCNAGCRVIRVFCDFGDE